MFSLNSKDKSKEIEDAFKIINFGLNKVDPKVVIPNSLSLENNKLTINNKKYNIGSGKVIIIGGGKSSINMVIRIEDIFRNKKKIEGLVNSPVSGITEQIKLNIASHPIPDKNGVSGVNEMLKMTKDLKKDDLVICLISSGGSSLLPNPVDEISLEDLQLATKLMLKKGIEVFEIQRIRKHLSKVKGGMLAKHLTPAKVITLIISDLVNPNDVVASGPTEPDESTYKDALDVINKYKIKNNLPKSIINHLEIGFRGEIQETPKTNDRIFQNVSNVVLADYHTAMNAMKNKAISLGYDVIVRDKPLLGGIGTQTDLISKEILSIENKIKPVVFIYNSELTVNVTGDGIGGRCQEHIIRLTNTLKNKTNYTLVSVGSDGIDNTSKAAGACVDQSDFKKWENLDIDIENYINNNDSYNLLSKTDSIIEGGVTGTCVGDLHLCILSNNKK